MSNATNKKLLVSAAKAAGVSVCQWNDGSEPYSSGGGFVLADNRIWNPLSDEGDALRLAIDLEMFVDMRNGRVRCSTDKSFGSVSEGFGYENASSRWATRLAIVRVAADLAKTLGKKS